MAQGAPPPSALLQLSDDVLEVVGHKISNALRPAVACALAACNHNLWRVMRAPLATLQPRHAAAQALVAKVSSSCAALHEATGLRWIRRGLNASDMETLAMLFSSGALPQVEELNLSSNDLGDAGVSQLCRGFVSTRLTALSLSGTGTGTEGATALAAALTRGALPKLESLYLNNNRLRGDGLAALTAPLRRLPDLRCLNLQTNEVDDASVAALVDNLGAREFKKLEVLSVGNNPITDAGCVTLATAINGATLPLLNIIRLFGIRVSDAAWGAVDDALRVNASRRAGAAYAALARVA